MIIHFQFEKKMHNLLLFLLLFSFFLSRENTTHSVSTFRDENLSNSILTENNSIFTQLCECKKTLRKRLKRKVILRMISTSNEKKLSCLFTSPQTFHRERKKRIRWKKISSTSDCENRRKKCFSSAFDSACLSTPFIRIFPHIKP